MKSRMFRQLTPYETRTYFLADIDIARQRQAQYNVINAHNVKITKKMDRGNLLILSGVFGLCVPGGIIFEIIMVAKSVNRIFLLIWLSLVACSIISAIYFGQQANPGLALISTLAYVLLHLYPVFIGIKFRSDARKMKPMEYQEIRQEPPCTDEEFDAWLENRANTHFLNIIRELNLDDKISYSRQLLRVRGYILKGIKEARHYRSQDLHSKQGADGKRRYSMNTYTYFYPDKHQIMVFTFYINAMNWDDYRKKTEEYFYQDIIGVTSIDDYDTLYIDGKPYNYRTQRFSLKLSDGSAVSATVNSHPLDYDYLPTFDMPNSGIDTTIAQLRMLLREKKA